MSHNFSKGFSLTELIVSISIVSVILTVILMGQSGYTANASLNANISAAALAVREAQTYGISVRQLSPGVEEFNLGYGISFRTTTGGSNNEYIFYADRGPIDTERGKYSSNWSCPTDPSSECVAKTYMTGGVLITQICYRAVGGSETCSSDRRADITFTRPETSVSVRLFNPGGVNETVVPNLEYVKIRFVSTIGLNRYLYVYPTGQISVRNT